MQLTYDLVQNFLRGETCLSRLNINFRAGDTDRFNTHLFHPVKLCVGFAGAADGPHSEIHKTDEHDVDSCPCILNVLVPERILRPGHQ